MTMLSVLLAVAATLPLRDFALKSLAERLSKYAPTNSLARFVNYPNGAARGKFTPNPNFWLSDVDFSSVSPWNSGGGALRAGTAISKRHVIFAQHFPLWKGVRILFVGKDGGVCPCYIDKTKGIPSSDIMVASLDSELTPNIVPAKILPRNFAEHVGGCGGFPVVTFNRQEKAYLTFLNGMVKEYTGQRHGLCHKSDNPEWAKFREDIVVGDSGNPAFVLIGNQPILVYCLQGGGCGMGSAIHSRSREIQAAMDELCPGYKLEEFDFTAIERK